MFLILSAILPTFFLIALGKILKESLLKSNDFWNNAEKLSYYILFPALITFSLSKVDFYTIKVSKLIFALVSITILFAIALIIFQQIARIEKKIFTSIFQGSTRFSGYIFMSMTGVLYGEEGVAIMSIMIAYMLIITNIMSVLVLNIYTDSPREFSIKFFIKQFIFNPLIISCVIGVFISLLKVNIGDIIARFLNYLGQGALPMSLMCVGASLNFKLDYSKRNVIIATSIIKLIIFPFVALIFYNFIGLDGLLKKMGVLYASLPVPSNAYILSKQMDGDYESMSSIVTITTIFSIITITIILGYLG